MGIGLVDPILKPIADQLDATPSQVSLLFTSYMAVMGVAMLVTGVVSSRIGAKRTLLSGLALIIVFSGARRLLRAPSGRSSASAPAGAWATRCSSRPPSSTIVSVRAAARVAQAIILFEAALGLGIAAGPLVGGVLGSSILAWPRSSAWRC